MRNKKTYLFTTFLYVVVIVWACFILSINRRNAQTRINQAVEAALLESMDKDLEKRLATIPYFSSGLNTQKKYTRLIKSYSDGQAGKIKTDTLTLPRSMDALQFNKLAKHLLTSKIPSATICPDSLLALFRKELERRQLETTAAGIIYEDGEQTYYSKNDSTGYTHASFCAEADSFDIAYRLKVTGWVNYGAKALFKHWDMAAYIRLVLLLCGVIGMYALAYILRRKKRQPETVKETETKESINVNAALNEIRTDPATNTIHVGEEEVGLGEIEFKLLTLLLKNPGCPTSIKQIKAYVWENVIADNRTVYVHISNLKKVIEKGHYTIVNIRNKGYIITKTEDDTKNTDGPPTNGNDIP